MSTQGPFDGEGYTVFRDKPKTNGTGTSREENGTSGKGSTANGSSDDALKAQDRRDGDHRWDDPDWSILDDRRGDLPGFPINTLSARCQRWVERAAHGAGATFAHVAVPLLGITSSLIGTARRVKASRSWTQPMTTWTGVVGFSGTSKTPGIDATKRPLSQIERDRRGKIAELQRAHEGRVEAAKAARAQWKKDLKRAAQGKVVSNRRISQQSCFRAGDASGGGGSWAVRGAEALRIERNN
jgi:hypothetical protein